MITLRDGKSYQRALLFSVTRFKTSVVLIFLVSLLSGLRSLRVIAMAVMTLLLPLKVRCTCILSPESLPSLMFIITDLGT
ncbi:hypothetical protein ALQ20_200202 [Pseudomonas syringae pv. atrofaciens]|nr:hypothetical protein ALQ20_200202 [Pseudomonas syringae pv. atrofaciens]